MYGYNTGETEVIHLPYLKLKIAQEIDEAIGKVARESHAEGRVSMNILKNGFVNVMEIMIRIFSK